MRKIQLVIMVKNGGDTIQQVLDSWSNHVDIIRIYDTGSTDNTQSICKKFQNRKKVKLQMNYLNFIDFSTTRNKCLDLCSDPKYYWTVFMDDSYALVDSDNNFRKCLQGVPEAFNCMDINITRGSIVYKSKRITKTATKLRYFGKVHEDVYFHSDYTVDCCHINDIPTEKQKIRTMTRLVQDLKLFGNSERDLYFKANTLQQMWIIGSVPFIEVVKAYNARIYCGSDYHEETFTCLMVLGNMFIKVLQRVKENGDNDVLESVDERTRSEATKHYIKAALVFPPRAGEAYLFAYLINGSNKFIEMAFKKRYLTETCCLPIDLEIYNAPESREYPSRGGAIENYYYRSIRSKIHQEIKDKGEWEELSLKC